MKQKVDDWKDEWVLKLGITDYMLYNQKTCCFKDTHKENTSNKTQGLTKSMNINILVIGSLNELYKKFLYSISFLKKVSI